MARFGDASECTVRTFVCMLVGWNSERERGHALRGMCLELRARIVDLGRQSWQKASNMLWLSDIRRCLRKTCMVLCTRFRVACDFLCDRLQFCGSTWARRQGSCADFGEDVEHYFLIAILLSCSKSMNKGIGVDNMHYLNDGLWKVLGRDYSVLFVFYFIF